MGRALGQWSRQWIGILRDDLEHFLVFTIDIVTCKHDFKFYVTNQCKILLSYNNNTILIVLGWFFSEYCNTFLTTYIAYYGAPTLHHSGHALCQEASEGLGSCSPCYAESVCLEGGSDPTCNMRCIFVVAQWPQAQGACDWLQGSRRVSGSTIWAWVSGRRDWTHARRSTSCCHRSRILQACCDLGHCHIKYVWCLNNNLNDWRSSLTPQHFMI